MEIWKIIPSTKGFYEASSEGQIRRRIQVRGCRAGRIIKQRPTTTSSYLTVGLSIQGQTRRCSVARLVCEAFHGSPPDGYEVNHKDFNPINNQVNNLEWCTRSYNLKYSYRAGRKIPSSTRDDVRKKLSEAQKNRFKKNPESFARGERNTFAKYSEAQMKQALLLRHRNPDTSISEIAKQVGISYESCRLLIKGERWKYLKR